jgi:hypothetical protein
MLDPPVRRYRITAHSPNEGSRTCVHCARVRACVRSRRLGLRLPNRNGVQGCGALWSACCILRAWCRVHAACHGLHVESALQKGKLNTEASALAAGPAPGFWADSLPAGLGANSAGRICKETEHAMPRSVRQGWPDNARRSAQHTHCLSGAAAADAHRGTHWCKRERPAHATCSITAICNAVDDPGMHRRAVQDAVGSMPHVRSRPIAGMRCGGGSKAVWFLSDASAVARWRRQETM